MLKSEINGLAKSLIEAIDNCNIPEIITSILNSDNATNTEAALDAFRKFLEATQGYNSSEQQLLEVLGLEKLRDSAFWAHILKADDVESKEDIREVYSSIEFTRDYLPGILALTDQNHDMISVMTEKGEAEGIQYVPLSVVMIEEQEFSTPVRLILLFEAIQGLYELIGRLKKLPAQDLVVTNCDSGHDKQFDFLGNAEIIEGVKSIILSLWDRVVFYREDKTGKQLELIVQSLPILDEINEMERTGLLEKEEAEILRRQASSSAKKFSQAGVTIPEMEAAAKYDPRILMHPDQRFLSAPPEPEVPSGMVVHVDEDDLDENEVPEGFKNLDEPESSLEKETEPTRETVAETEEQKTKNDVNDGEDISTFYHADNTEEPIIPNEPVPAVKSDNPEETMVTDDLEKPEEQVKQDIDADLEDLNVPEATPNLEELIEANSTQDPKVAASSASPPEQTDTADKNSADEDNIYAKIAEEYLKRMRQETKEKEESTNPAD